MGKAAAAHRATARKLKTLPEEGIAYGVKKVRTAALRQATTDTGGDRVLSGLRNGKPLTVTVKRSTARGLATAEVRAGPPKQRAPWFWLEKGTKAGPRPRRRKDGRVVTYEHGGTRSKKTWTSSVAPALADTRAEFERLHRKAVT